MPIVSIHITGYRGPLTNNLFLPAGEYAVGDRLDIAARIVPDELARYLAETGQIVGFEVAGVHPTEEPADPPEGVPSGEMPSADPSEEESVMAQWTDEERRSHTLDYLNGLSVEELRAFADRHEIDLPTGKVKKADLVELIAGAAAQPDSDDQDQPDRLDEPEE